MNKYPICIISKDRSDICTTHKLFDEYGIEYFYMVEPQDYQDYYQKFGNKVINIGKDDAGIYFVRNFCIEWSKQNGYDMHWQIDDDLRNFYYRPMNHFKGTRDRQLINNPLEMILHIEDIAQRCVNYGAGCITHDGFAFSKKNDIDINKMVYCFHLINNDINARYKPNTSEDIDFSVQVLMEGYVTMIFNTYSFTTPQSGKIKGGCNSSMDYMNDGRYKRNIELCKTYPKWFTEYTKNGQSEIKPSKIWKTFKQKPMTKR